MKSKILSYLLGGIIVLSAGFITSYVHADCNDECVNVEWNREMREWCMSNCKNQQQTKECKDGCCGIKLNTDFPGIGNCIELKKGGDGVNSTTVLPKTIGSLMKIIMSVALVVCFIMIIIAGIKRTSNSPKEAQDLIKKVAITILVLGLSGVILKVINPLFFT